MNKKILEELQDPRATRGKDDDPKVLRAHLEGSGGEGTIHLGWV